MPARTLSIELSTRGDGPGHARAALLGAPRSLPYSQGAPTLGAWQQVVLVDFDIRPPGRRVVLQLVGE